MICREDRAPAGFAKAHDVERHANAGECADEQRRDDRRSPWRRRWQSSRSWRTLAGDHQHLLADAYNLDQLGRIRIEIDHVAGNLARAACVPVCMATPTSALGERRRIVGAIAAHPLHQPAPALLGADIVELGLGRRLGDEIVDPPASEATVAAVIGLSPESHHHGADTHGGAISAKRSLMSGFTVSLRWMKPRRAGRGPSASASGVCRLSGRCDPPPR